MGLVKMKADYMNTENERENDSVNEILMREIIFGCGGRGKIICRILM